MIVAIIAEREVTLALTSNITAWRTKTKGDLYRKAKAKRIKAKRAGFRPRADRQAGGGGINWAVREANCLWGD